ncbi:unnamed protein product [Prorocentrum cordatum]|uniref:START domain-containing protein n=1 Tax=Prorocentrum cordatum TaxID=2364126 RepID=A0ABN9RIL0_9DINO|nr:unnamed protein product [Polarella glacialis]
MRCDAGEKHSTPITFGEFELLLEKEREPCEGWDQPHVPCPSAAKEIRVAKRSNGPGLITLRAWATVPGVDINVAFTLFYGKERMKWDKVFAQMEVLRDDIQGSELLYSVLSPPVYGVQARDFLQFRRVRQQEDGSVLIVLRSAEHPDRPEDRRYIRAESYFSGYVLRQEVDSSGLVLKIFLMSCVDIKGSIPKWVVNSLAPRKPSEWIDSLAKAVHGRRAGGPLQDMRRFAEHHAFDYEACDAGSDEGAPPAVGPPSTAPAVPLDPVVPVALPAAPLEEPAMLKGPVAFKGTAATAALAVQRAAAAKREPAGRSQQERRGVQFVPGSGGTPRELAAPDAPGRHPGAPWAAPAAAPAALQLGPSSPERPEGVLGKEERTPSQSSRAPPQSSRSAGPASPTRSGLSVFRVHVPPRYPGVHYRASMDREDRSQHHAVDGETVAGRLSPDGEWLRVVQRMSRDGEWLVVEEAELYLPMRAGAGAGTIQVLRPVGQPPLVGARSAPLLQAQTSFVVRVPRGYPGIQYRRSKDLQDRHHLFAARGEEVCGHVEDSGLWLRVDRGGETLFLPISLAGTSVLVLPAGAARDDAGIEEGTPPQAPRRSRGDAAADGGGAQGGSPGSFFAACSCGSPPAVGAEVVQGG